MYRRPPVSDPLSSIVIGRLLPLVLDVRGYTASRLLSERVGEDTGDEDILITSGALFCGTTSGFAGRFIPSRPGRGATGFPEGKRVCIR